MEKKHWVGVGILAAVVLLLGVFFPRPGPSVVERVIERLGAIPGTDVDSNFFSIGGVDFFYQTQALTSTSSALCAIQNPFRPGTTTIDQVIFNARSGFVAAYEFDISTSSSRFASTSVSLLDRVAVGAGAKNTAIWVPRSGTTSVIRGNDGTDQELAFPEGGESPFILTGTDWLTVRVATGVPGGETLLGECSFKGTKVSN